MREVGVRELKSSLSEMLRLVARGERVRVTLHGRAVADIVPAGAAEGDQRLRTLVAAGRVMPPSSSRPKRAPRLAHVSQSASAVVLADRDSER